MEKVIEELAQSGGGLGQSRSCMKKNPLSRMVIWFNSDKIRTMEAEEVGEHVPERIWSCMIICTNQ